MSFTETAEQMAPRQAVAQLGGSYGYDYMVTKAAPAATPSSWARFVVPTDAAGLEYTKIEMDIISADHQRVSR